VNNVSGLFICLLDTASLGLSICTLEMFDLLFTHARAARSQHLALYLALKPIFPRDPSRYTSILWLKLLDRFSYAGFL
jgi:hypothetical protein